MSIAAQIDARLFALQRVEDETGVSGTGIVAEGVQFSDGTVAMRWRSHIRSTVFYESIKACEAIHGHGGRTRIVFLDEGENVWHGTSFPASDL